MTATIDHILTDQAETVPIDAVSTYPGNPRRGNLQAIRESLRANGQFRPLVVQRSTGHILGGNHTWQAAKAEGWSVISVVYVDVDDKAAKRIVLADNRTNDLATYDTDLLAEVLKGLESPLGTGYTQQDYDDLISAIETQDAGQVEDIIRPPVTIRQLDDDDDAEMTDVAGVQIGAGVSLDDDDDDAPADDAEDLRDELGELQGILQLREDMDLRGKNYYGIPDLNPKGLLAKLPQPIDTWAGEEATPDDGQTWWVWNYGVAPKKGLPMDRAILCFYTYDTYFEGWWDNPAFYTAKVLNAGITTVVVPDFSYYTDMAPATWVFNTYRAQWMGRYFQEAGLKVIPRLQFAIDKKDSVSLDFCMAGIPKNPPVLASCMHNMNSDEEFQAEVHNVIRCLQELQPVQWLVYGGNPAQRVIDAVDPVAKGLVGEVLRIDNYAAKRRGTVYDKREGLGGRAKDRARKKRDKTTEAGDLAPQAKRSGKRAGTDDEDAVPDPLD